MPPTAFTNKLNKDNPTNTVPKHKPNPKQLKANPPTLHNEVKPVVKPAPKLPPPI